MLTQVALYLFLCLSDTFCCVVSVEVWGKSYFRLLFCVLDDSYTFSFSHLFAARGKCYLKLHYVGF